MLDSLTTQEYRGLPALMMSGLRRINLIVGCNGAGKTRLLDQIELYAPQRATDANVAERAFYKGGRETLEGVQLLAPYVRKLAFIRGGIYADIGESCFLPLEQMGLGASRVGRIAGLIAASRDGVVIADDIDQSIGHNAIEAVWGLIHRLTLQYDVQLFASLHSAEFLRGAIDYYNKTDLGLLAAYRIDGPRAGRPHRLTQYVDEDLRTVLEGDWEIRG